MQPRLIRRGCLRGYLRGCLRGRWAYTLKDIFSQTETLCCRCTSTWIEVKQMLQTICRRDSCMNQKSIFNRIIRVCITCRNSKKCIQCITLQLACNSIGHFARETLWTPILCNSKRRNSCSRCLMSEIGGSVGGLEAFFIDFGHCSD